MCQKGNKDGNACRAAAAGRRRECRGGDTAPRREGYRETDEECVVRSTVSWDQKALEKRLQVRLESKDIESGEDTMDDADEDTMRDEDMCWICHDGHCVTMPLERTCRCPWMKVHRQCLARWQLQQAGKSEERRCRFCKDTLPDWRDVHAGLPRAQPIMTVVHEGVTHQVVVEPGEEGQRKFQDDIRRIFGLEGHETIQLTFGCRIPDSRQEVVLEGWESYDAAVHCASLSAGQRQKRIHSVSPEKRVVSRRMSGGSGVLRRLFSKNFPSNEESSRAMTP
ncbi:hypothetical protein PSENEW3_00002978 [Picochlorum sp. SENEW3]|nr:hypothetical protein PSENEW3_00002978 [Picochlorum sp. SENEW3]